MTDLELLKKHEPLVGKIGRLNSEQFYLRFVNKSLNDSDTWVGWGGLSSVRWVI